MLASASGPHSLSVSQICIWDLEQMVLKRTLTHHQFDIVCLAYARDDRFLVSVGTFNTFSSKLEAPFVIVCFNPNYNPVLRLPVFSAYFLQLYGTCTAS